MAKDIDFIQDAQAAQSGCDLDTPSTSESVQHLLIGTPTAVKQTIHRLHQMGYAEVGWWSRLIPVAATGKVMSTLIRRFGVKRE